MKKQPCLSHHGHRPRRTCLTRADLHEVGDLLALTNSLVQLHNLDGGSQVTPNQSRRQVCPQKVKDGVLMMNSLLLCSNDSLPNSQLSLTDLAMVERLFEWKATWGRLYIKSLVVGLEYLGLNT